jgi:ABC-2 type transport system ATP-binding protein
MQNSVELQQVVKSFGSTVAVDRLDLAVPEGSIYGFIGPNGSGKTTTLRLMLRIFQPDAGRVVVLGSEFGNVADDRLGYLPEERGLYKRMNVLDVIDYFARLKGFVGSRREALVWLERLDAATWANRRIDTLSKGMAQKVQFIVAAIAQPKLLILDEPFSGLDPVNLDLLKEAVLSLRDRGTTVVFSTHDMNVAATLCDMVLMIFQGRKVLDGSLTEIQNNYPVNSLRVRLAAGAELPDDLVGLASTSRSDGFHILHLASGSQPQAILQQIAANRVVEHFEIVRPSLHDIFVEIARPQESQRASA